MYLCWTHLSERVSGGAEYTLRPAEKNIACDLCSEVQYVSGDMGGVYEVIAPTEGRELEPVKCNNVFCQRYFEESTYNNNCANTVYVKESNKGVDRCPTYQRYNKDKLGITLEMLTDEDGTSFIFLQRNPKNIKDIHKSKLRAQCIEIGLNVKGQTCRDDPLEIHI